MRGLLLVVHRGRRRVSVDNPAVRLVRVAVALCDRFAELLKGPSHVTARKQQGALVGFGGNQDDLSMRIGEAQQIYPEIWRHLDDARTAFAATGIDVTGYDALRAAEGQGQGAAVDIIQTKHGFGQHAIHEHVKNANFNHAGLARARRACDALMRATPQIDWAGIAKAEANDPEAAAFGRSLRRKRMIQLGILGVLIAAPFLIVMYLRHAERVKADERRQAYDAPSTPDLPLTEAVRTELTATAAQLRSRIATARKNWAATATPDALKAIAPGSRPCPVPVNGPAKPAADAYIRTGTVDPEAMDGSCAQRTSPREPHRASSRRSFSTAFAGRRTRPRCSIGSSRSGSARHSLPISDRPIRDGPSLASTPLASGS